jgi:hypothetical protein
MPVGLSSLLLLRSRDNELSRPPAFHIDSLTMSETFVYGPKKGSAPAARSKAWRGMSSASRRAWQRGLVEPERSSPATFGFASTRPRPVRREFATFTV